MSPRQYWNFFELSVLTAATSTIFPSSGITADFHLGQPVFDHVTLQLRDSNSPDGCIFGAYPNPVNLFRWFPNGTIAKDRFKVPNGKNLIITDIYWEGAPRTGPGSAGTATQLHLWYLDNTDPFLRSTPVTNSVATETALVGGSEHLIAGLRIPPGKVICGRITDVDTHGSRDRSLGAVSLHGYLVKQN